MSTTGMMKALQKLVGKAATAVQDEGAEPLKGMKGAVQAQQVNQQPLYVNWSTTAASTSTHTWPNYPAQLQGTVYGQASQAGLGAPTPYFIQGYSQTVYQQPAPILTFTDDQMTSFLVKLAALLTRGWECIRCHRIWAPQINGCEFCNFIDRLEGKDVDRDDATQPAA